MPKNKRPNVTAISARLSAETLRQLQALEKKWSDNRTGALTRCIERIYDLEIRDFETKDTAK